jgi:hypothetical protein
MKSTGFSKGIDRRNFLSAAAASSVGIAVKPAASEEDSTGSASAQPKFRVLSLDGGGARGYLSIMKLANIEKYLDRLSGTKVPLGRRFDLIAGTSTEVSRSV